MPLTTKQLRAVFPFPEIRPLQDAALEHMARTGCNVTIEAPTGTGKSALGVTGLRAMGGGLYLAPTKVLLDQLKRDFPEIQVIMGRSEYPCLFYTQAEEPEDVNARDVPCYTLDCGHRVNQETGETKDKDCDACPYLQAKFEASQSVDSGKGIVACTTAFALINRTLVKRWRELEPPLVVLDEGHSVAQTARRMFEYVMSDYHLSRVVGIVSKYLPEQADLIDDFRKRIKGITIKAKNHVGKPLAAGKQRMLAPEEIRKLLEALMAIDHNELSREILGAVGRGEIDPYKNREELKLLEDIARNIPNRIRSLEYALDDEDRERAKRALSYVIACHYWDEEAVAEAGKGDADPPASTKGKRIKYFIAIRSYFVHPVIKKTVGPRLLTMSATIGDPKVFGHDTGIRRSVVSLASSFPIDNTRIFLPTDTPELGMQLHKKRVGRKQYKKVHGPPQHKRRNRSIRQVMEAAARFKAEGHRCLLVVGSNIERDRGVSFASDAGLEPVSYGKGLTAREAALAFRDDRQGDILIGTASQYGQGIDLPAQSAPVIFFLRPVYPPPDDPQVQFEEQRFGSNGRWMLAQWRVMLQILQVRGRNVRSMDDVGVCIFMDKRFRSFLLGTLPEWLRPAYRHRLDMAGIVDDTLKLLDEAPPKATVA